MKNKINKTLVIGLVAVLVMALGVVAVFAQTDDTPTAPDTQVPGTELPDRGDFHGIFDLGRGGFHGPDGGDRDEALAEALGITVEELQAARQKVAAQRIADAVEQGLITQDQGNTMLAMQALQGYLDKDALMAEALGLTVDELTAAREDGTLKDIVANITPADLQANMQAAAEAVIAQAVSDHVITQEQADLVLAQMENGMGFFGPLGGGHHGGFGGRHGGFHRQPPSSDSNESTESPAPTGVQFVPAFDL